MSIKLRFFALCLSMLFITGCIMVIADNSGKSQNKPSIYEPAILLSSNDLQRKALQQAASKLLYGRDVKLTNSAFLKNPTLSIDRIAANDQQQRPIDGRIVDTSNSFIELSLWIKNGECWLKRKDTDESIEIQGLNCIAL